MSLGPWRSWVLKDHVAGGLDLVLIGQEKSDFPINIALTIHAPLDTFVGLFGIYSAGTEDLDLQISNIYT